MTVAEVVAEVQRLGVPMVLLTGGEPLLQAEIGSLCDHLLAERFRVMLETSGAHPLEAIPSEVVRVVDVKTPGSGEANRTRWEVLSDLRPGDAIKFVLCNEADYRWAAEQIQRRGLAGRAELLLSPVAGSLDPRELVTWLLRDRLPVRLNLQLHKLIWGPDAQGV
jgi:7-carboxy-7-deazaguanine synthase